MSLSPPCRNIVVCLVLCRCQDPGLIPSHHVRVPAAAAVESWPPPQVIHMALRRASKASMRNPCTRTPAVRPPERCSALPPPRLLPVRIRTSLATCCRPPCRARHDAQCPRHCIVVGLAPKANSKPEPVARDLVRIFGHTHSVHIEGQAVLPQQHPHSIAWLPCPQALGAAGFVPMAEGGKPVTVPIVSPRLR